MGESVEQAQLAGSYQAVVHWYIALKSEDKSNFESQMFKIKTLEHHLFFGSKVNHRYVPARHRKTISLLLMEVKMQM